MRRRPNDLWFAVVCTVMVLLGTTTVPAPAHEIVGQVTPLMLQMKRVLILIENQKHDQAIEEIRNVYKDFSHDSGMGRARKGMGLQSTAEQVDRRFETQIGVKLDESIEQRNTRAIRKLLHQLAFLLMLEKFDALQSTFGRPLINFDTQRTIYWLGRNYYSYLLEPVLAKQDPIEEKRLDRMLNSMLYRLEDNQPEAFLRIQAVLATSVATAFSLAFPEQTVQGAALKHPMAPWSREQSDIQGPGVVS